MDISKSFDFFDPGLCKHKIHIIGCGAIGSTLAENLVRYGIRDIVLYDFDAVDGHNIANQLYVQSDIGKMKVNALAEHLYAINPELRNTIILKPEGYTEKTNLNGYVFLCVDSIELRKEICIKNRFNMNIKSVFDFRMGLTNGQCYAADWSNPKDVESLLSNMNFTDEEARAETPVTACNLTLSVNSSVRMIVALGTANFIQYVKKGKQELKHIILCDAFAPGVDAI